MMRGGGLATRLNEYNGDNKPTKQWELLQTRVDQK